MNKEIVLSLINALKTLKDIFKFFFANLLHFLRSLRFAFYLAVLFDTISPHSHLRYKTSDTLLNFIYSIVGSLADKAGRIR